MNVNISNERSMAVLSAVGRVQSQLAPLATILTCATDDFQKSRKMQYFKNA